MNAPPDPGLPPVNVSLAPRLRDPSVVWLTLATVLAFVVLEHTLYFAWSPPRPSDDERSDMTPGPHQFDNRLGQGGWHPKGYAAVLLLVFYPLKLLITLRSGGRLPAVCWYALLVAASLPPAWLLVTTDWNNWHANAPAYWVGTPVGLLLVPTITFLRDLDRLGSAGMMRLLVRSLVEVLVLVPVWALVVWPTIELMCGFYWI